MLSDGARAKRLLSSTTLAGIITTIAGYGAIGYFTGGYSGDGGPATAALLNSPYGVAVDTAGNIYIADSNNNRIRMINNSTGYITTIAGNDEGDYSGDNGPATAALLYIPYDVAVDTAGNIYIADTYNERIRMITKSTGNITTIAGTGD